MEMEVLKPDSENEAVREEYGEPDKPMPNDKIQDFDGKFMEWDVYKMQRIMKE